MYNCLVDFAERFNILYHNQFGFRKGHATSHAVVLLHGEQYIFSNGPFPF